MADPGDRSSDDSVVWARWHEVDRLFEAALELPPAERDRFIVEASRDDLALLRTLRELLALTETGQADTPRPGAALLRAAWSATQSEPPAPPLEPGQRAGPYRILAELGRGGMATVYEAERDDGSFRRRVAVKVLRRGVDTDDVVRRFLAERQILSGLTHPNIARLLDGGATDDGRPYLVIDLVNGEPITRYADQRRLAIRDRLMLFLQVAGAVQYAHQRFVVHRDLKPSNILVTTDGQAKLLDFGIAKLLDPDSDDAIHTRAGVQPLTPQYASPEQLRGEPITTASDIYQLGILLHTLLTGTRPHERAGGVAHGPTPTGGSTRPSQLVRRLASGRQTLGREVDAANVQTIAAERGTTPATLQRALRGDLDTIVLRALRNDPEQRYESVQAFAADVRHHVDGRPIAARPPSVPYRVAKFLGRNRWFAPVAATLLVGLISFVATQYRHAHQLEAERNVARAQADRAEQLKDFMIGLFGSADPYTPADPERGRAITVVEALSLGAERARIELSDRPMLRADLLSAIAHVYESLDQRAPALSLIGEVLDIRRRTEPAHSPEYASELGRRADLLSLTGHPDSADALFRQWIELERTLFGPDHPRVADALIGHAYLFSNQGDHETAYRLQSEAARILRAAGPAYRERLAGVLSSLADSHRELQRNEQADSAARESLQLHRELFGDEHPNTAMARVHLAQVIHARGEIGEAAQLYREALPVLERTLGPEHRNTVATWNNLGNVLTDAEDYPAAERVHRRMLELRRKLSGGTDNRDVASSLQNLAANLIRQERFAEAESLSFHAATIYSRTTPEGHFLRAFPLLTVAEARLMRGDGAGAERVARAAVTILRDALPSGHYATATAECRLGAALDLQGRSRAAEPIVTASLAMLESSDQAPDRLVRECRAVRDALGAEPGR